MVNCSLKILFALSSTLDLFTSIFMGKLRYIALILTAKF